jgi:P-type E1-E2 ATPase
VLETVGRVDVVVLDKTGTVTAGDFGVLACAGDESDLPRVAALEAYSQHPLGRALVKWIGQEFGGAGASACPNVRDVEIHQGAGISGTVASRYVFAGNLRMCPRLPSADLAGHVAEWEAQGHTAIYYGTDATVSGAIAFGDCIKDDAAALVTELKQRGMRTLLVSGDARATTEWVAAKIGVDEATAEVLPEDKVELVRRLQKAGATVAMIGDGVNDAPSLAQADLGIALGSGTDIAMKAAPMVIPGSGLGPVLEAFDLAVRTVRAVRQNLFWAFAYNTVGIALAVSGVLHPIFAAGAMVLSSLSVIWNAVRSGRIQGISNLAACIPHPIPSKINRSLPA